MASQIVYWNSLEQICCHQTLPVDVILCCDSSLVAQQGCAGGGTTNFPYPGISGQLVALYVVNNDRNCAPVYRYTIQYNDTQLVPGAKLTTADIQGLLCLGCLTTFIRAIAGNEVFLTNNDDGTITFTSQHGCTYTFSPSGNTFQDTDSIDFTVLPGGIVTANVNQSASAGNILSILPDGLFVTSDFVQPVADTATVDLSVTAGTLTADVIISPDVGNILVALPDGLYVPVDFIQSLQTTNSILLSIFAHALSADVIISPDAGNIVSVQPNGLFVPAQFIDSVSDTSSVNLTVGGAALSADVKISAGFGNQISVAPDGLNVSLGAGVSVSDSTTLDLTLNAGANISGDVIISPNAGNQLSDAGNGLFVPLPSSSFISSVTDTTTVDLAVSFGDLTANVIVDTTPNNQLSVAAGGLYVGPDFINSISDTATVDLDATAGILTASVNLCALNADGWVPTCESWSAASATTITVPSNATLKYAIGDKIRLVQDATTKYFNVITVAATLLTVTGGTDYTLSGNPITSPFFSHEESPVGFPGYFNYTPTFGGFSVDPASPVALWSLHHKLAKLICSTGEGTSNATTFTVSLLVPAFSVANLSTQAGGFDGTDNSIFVGNVLAIIANASPTIVQLFTGSGATGWTAALNKAGNFNISYYIAP